MSYLKHLLIPFPASIASAIVLTFGIVVLFLSFPAHPAEAASMTFTSDTTITTNQTIASHETWSINDGVTLTIASGVIVQNNGTIFNDGVLINNGSLVNFQGLTHDDMGIENYERIINYGTLTTSGRFHMNTHSSPIVINNGTFNIFGEIGIAGILNNYGTINNSGTIMMDGGFNNYGTINNDAAIVMFSFDNKGTINNKPSGTMGGSGDLLTSGTINNFGNFFSYLTHNSGTINNYGNLSIGGDGSTLDNLSTGTINNNASATINNYGTYNNAGTTNNNGTINNKCGATFNDTGTFSGNPVDYEICITLAPASANNPAGGNHTVIATVTDSSGRPQADISMTFNVTSGPNVGTTGTNVTDAAGNSTFTYTDTGGAGTDVIRASFNDQVGAKHYSNAVTKNWIGPPPPPPPYTLELKQGVSKIPHGGFAEINQAVTANATTNSSTATQVNFTRINPDSTVDTQIVSLTLGSAQYTFTPAIAGHYTILADFGNGVIVEKELNISFNVIPESPIGLIALVVSSFAALGAYMKFRTKV